MICLHLGLFLRVILFLFFISLYDLFKSFDFIHMFHLLFTCSQKTSTISSQKVSQKSYARFEKTKKKKKEEIFFLNTLIFLPCVCQTKCFYRMHLYILNCLIYMCVYIYSFHQFDTSFILLVNRFYVTFFYTILFILFYFFSATPYPVCKKESYVYMIRTYDERSKRY